MLHHLLFHILPRKAGDDLDAGFDPAVELDRHLDRLFGGDLRVCLNWLFSIGSTALFTFCILALAGWVFYRRDY